LSLGFPADARSRGVHPSPIDNSIGQLPCRTRDRCWKRRFSFLVMTPLNYRYTPPEIDHTLTVSGCSPAPPKRSN
jgi:hypothetical protein